MNSNPPKKGRQSGEHETIGRKNRPSGEHAAIPTPLEARGERTSGRRRASSASQPGGDFVGIDKIAIVDPRIETYLDGLCQSGEPVLQEMERFARDTGFPIIGPLLGRLLRQLAMTISARDIFEMGSGYGYSTYYLAQAVGPGGRVVHTDFSQDRSDQAKTQLAQASLADRVTFEVGDALQILVNYPGPFDLVFIDVDKEAYPDALELARARVRPGGYIVADNVLWQGRVLDPANADPATQGVLRYTRAALAATDLLTTILPVRDGVALHLKLHDAKRRK